MALVKNISARLHVVAGVKIAPEQTAEIPNDWVDAINKEELVLVEESKEVLTEDKPKKK